MGAVRDIAVDLAPVAGFLVLLLGAWLGSAAISARSAADRRAVSPATSAVPAAAPIGGDARLPRPRRDRTLTPPGEGR